MLFLVIALGGVKRDGRHAADGGTERILAAGEGRKVELTAPALERLEGLAVERDAGALGVVDGRDQMRPALANLRQVGAGNDRTLRVDHADDRIGRFLKLQNDVLKNPTGHIRASLTNSEVCAFCQLDEDIIPVFVSRLQELFSFFHKKRYVFWTFRKGGLCARPEKPYFPWANCLFAAQGGDLLRREQAVFALRERLIQRERPHGKAL